MYWRLILLSLAIIGLTLHPRPTQGQGADGSFYTGADLSYLNEMEDCGAVYQEGGRPQDIYGLFAGYGATLVRTRLWHTPTWTDYSTLDDVIRTFSRARDAGMATLLAIHYSDTWADPSHQTIPAAWEDIDEGPDLEAAVYQYTYDVMIALHAEGLAPAFVQIGNEINSGLIKRDDTIGLEWGRDSRLILAGIQAVRDFGQATDSTPQIVLHIAQPENAMGWLIDGEAHGITDFDVIGLSYYPQWSPYTIDEVGQQVDMLRQHFGKEVMIVETAYPWTNDYADSANNILSQELAGYPVSIEGQRQFMLDLTQTLINHQALGVVYWEPAWVSTGCSTPWGRGSHWENATFFDFQHDNELLPVIDFLALRPSATEE
ncbi:MAG: glycosyl hydrolase 53 family protein [Anaerolineales bacterium]|nr:glycosyl hydrolase 53 family protein [Anaerolineales bacterium]